MTSTVAQWDSGTKREFLIKYLPLYCNQVVLVDGGEHHEGERRFEAKLLGGSHRPNRWMVMADNKKVCHVEIIDIVLLLKPLITMSDDDIRKVLALRYRNHYQTVDIKENDGRFIHFRMHNGKRWSPLNRVMIPLKPSNADEVAHLISQGYDLFKLINQNLAVSKEIYENHERLRELIEEENKSSY